MNKKQAVSSVVKPAKKPSRIGKQKKSVISTPQKKTDEAKNGADNLFEKLQQEQEKLLQLRLDAGRKKLKDTSLIRKTRKEIARILTAIELKELLKNIEMKESQKSGKV